MTLMTIRVIGIKFAPVVEPRRLGSLRGRRIWHYNMVFIYISIFLISCFVLFWAGSRFVKSAIRIAKFLKWREFVIAFFVMAMAASLPNLFVGINSALHKIPQLSFGDIVGGNMVDMTLAVAFVLLVGGANLPADSKLIQSSALFTVIIAVLPLILVMDGRLDRIDGFILILAFIFYSSWLFSNEERYKKIYGGRVSQDITRGFKLFVKDSGKLIIYLLLILIASDGIVRSAKFFSNFFDVSLPMVGILIVGLGNCIPEIYFAVISAKKSQNWMILGDLMGSVIVCATLVLGIVALICPIQITEISSFAIARIFLILSALFFLIVVRTGKQITKREGAILLSIYIIFLIAEVLLG